MVNESPSREQDRAERIRFLQLMKDAIRDGLPMTAKMCGETSKQLAERIATHDYSQADAWLAKEKKILGYNPK